MFSAMASNTGQTHHSATTLPLHSLPDPAQALLKDRTRDASKRLFHKNRFDVRVIDVDFDTNGTSKCSNVSFTEAQHFQDLIDNPSNSRIRVISLHTVGGPLPVRISEDMMQHLQYRYGIDADFSHTLLSFGNSPLPSECGSSNLFHHQGRQGSTEQMTNVREESFSSLESLSYYSPFASLSILIRAETLGYQLQYVEENGRKETAMPWSSRQTGVYHHRTPSFDLWIILHQEKDGRFETELVKLAESGPEAHERRRRLLEEPFWLHYTLFALHIDTWRWHLRFLSKELDTRSNKVFTQTSLGDSVLGFDEVRELRRIYEQCIESQALCEGNNILLQHLQKQTSSYPTINAASPRTTAYDSWFLSALERQRGYLQGFTTLSKKLTNTIELSSYAIDCEYQRTSGSVNLNVLRLTIVSLIYLPASFVATLFGANFFVFNTDSNGLVTGSNVWILAVAWLILTCFTFILYLLMLWWKQRRAGRRNVALGGDVEKQGLLRRLTSERIHLGRTNTASSAVSIVMRRMSRVTGRP